MSFKASGPKTRPERMKDIPAPTPSTPHTANLGFSSRRSSTSSTTSSTTSFHSALNDPSSSSPTHPDPDPSHPSQTLHFTPSQEALHLNQSNTLKSQANTQFAHQDYSSALGTYDKAIAELPTYLDYELAVLQSNIAACHVQMGEWREAVSAAERGWECLENLDPSPKPKKEKEKKDGEEGGAEGHSKEVVELPEDNDEAANEEMLRRLDLSDQRKSDIRRIRTKLLLRRARARYMLGTTPPKPAASADKQDKNPFSQAASLTSPSSDSATASSTWSNLSAALTDYQTLSQPQYFSTLPASDQKTVRNALAILPGLAEKAKEQEVAEMMGKLKDLGNGILKPFGLSTDMFKMEKDPVSGGMSLRFDGGKK